MPRLLAIEWDSNEARVLVADQRGGKIVALRALVEDLGLPEAEDGPSAGERLAAMLSKYDIAKGEALIAIGRASIELREISVPPAPEDELPDMVRFQALSEFSALGDNWALDFAPLERTEEEVRVLAAAVSPQTIERSKTTFAEAGLEVDHLVLRPFAAASLLARSEEADEYQLIIDLLGDEADLTVVANRHVVLTRTIRLPNDQITAQMLRGEIRRTIAAAQNQLGGERVANIVLFGHGKEREKLRDDLTTLLDQPTKLFDPFSQVQLGGELAKELPEHRGRFAPLIGLLVDEATGQRHGIDFLNPRQRPEEKSNRLVYSIIGGVLAAAVIIGLGMIWVKRSNLDRQITELEKQEKELKEVSKKADVQIKHATEIDNWERGDVHWLAEMAELSNALPLPEDTMVHQIRGGASPQGGSYWIEGSVLNSGVITVIEQNVADKRHEVESAGGSPDDSSPEYAYRFKEKVRVKRAESIAEVLAEMTSETPSNSTEEGEQQ